MGQLLFVCAGGAVGSGARYLLAGWLNARYAGFPYGTLAVNLIGSFLIAVILQIPSDTLSPPARIALSAGVLGGFTTYSAFSFETLALFEAGAGGLAVGYVGATLCGCLLACWAGVLCGRAALGA